MTTATARTYAIEWTVMFRVRPHGGCSGTAVRVRWNRADAFRGIMPTHDRATFEDRGEPVALIPCDGCGRTYRVRGSSVRGRFNTSKPCTARCRGARTAECECECGGEQHGIDHA